MARRQDDARKELQSRRCLGRWLPLLMMRITPGRTAVA